MQATLTSWDAYPDGSLVIWAKHGSFCAGVTRSNDGNYVCLTMMCHHKGTQLHCEHVAAARLFYQEKINVTIEAQRERERQKIEDEIHRSKARLALLIQELGEPKKAEEPVLLETENKRKIIV